MIRRATKTASISLLIFLTACAEQPPQPVGQIDAAELAGRIASGSAPMILDVRSREEYEAGHVPGALHIPFDELAVRIQEIGDARDSELVVYCQSGRRAGIAGDILRSNNFSAVRDLDGHWQRWTQDGRAVAISP